VADGLDAGLPTEGAWIIRRSTLRVERMPRFAELCELRTWCSGAAKSVAERRTSISGDRGGAVESEAIWVHVDPVARRPVRLPAGFQDVYGPSAGGARPRTSLRHPASPPEGAERIDWAFGIADLDIAGHVNNTFYWRVAEELLDLEAGGSNATVLEAEYRAGIGAGPAFVHRDGSMLWITDVDGSLAATISAEPAQGLE
jgi:acyl-ACP thioesterase